MCLEVNRFMAVTFQLDFQTVPDIFTMLYFIWNANHEEMILLGKQHLPPFPISLPEVSDPKPEHNVHNEQLPCEEKSCSVRPWEKDKLFFSPDMQKSENESKLNGTATTVVR